MGKRGFTLTELLVSVSIVMVLAGLLFAILGTARGSSRQSTCVSNERQITTAMKMYVSDNDGGYPTYDDYNQGVGENQISIFAPYIHEELPHCPSVNVTKKYIAASAYPVGYAMNATLLRFEVDGMTLNANNESKFTDQTRTVMYFDYLPGFAAQGNIDAYRMNPKAEEKGTKESTMRHNGGANFSFVDGHVKWYKPSDVNGAQDNPASNNRPTFKSIW